MQINKPGLHYVQIVGQADTESYPLSKGRHSNEFLREIAHLRPRSNFISCVTRIRNSLANATHIFFQSQGFLYIHTPIITCSDCEGAGEMFQITSLMPKGEEQIKTIPTKKEGGVDYSKDFFKKPA